MLLCSASFIPPRHLHHSHAPQIVHSIAGLPTNTPLALTLVATCDGRCLRRSTTAAHLPYTRYANHR